MAGTDSTTLGPRTERTRHLAVSRKRLEQFQRRQADDELAWIAVVPIIVYTAARFQLCSVPRRPASKKRARAFVAAYGAGANRGWALHGDYLFQPTTENQRQSQHPIATRLGTERTPASPVRVSPSRAEQLERRAIALADSLTASAARHRVRLPKRDFVYRQFIAAAANLAWFEAVIEAARPRVSVIGSTHSFQGRALALASRRAGLPCVYVPHAPVLTDAFLADLPVDFVAARGEREREYYESFGADGSRIVAVGNPAVGRVAAMPDIDLRRPAAFALTHVGTEIFAGAVAIVRTALGPRVVASPHPRSDPREHIPGDWELWSGRTYDLLKTGPPAVIQCSSGSGLEALQLGIPTIEVAFAGEPPNYPYLDHPSLAVVSSPAELRSAVERARGATEAERRELRAWASGWVGAAGADAAEAGAALVRRAAEDGPAPNPVWDAWARSGRVGVRALFERLAHQLPRLKTLAT